MPKMGGERVASQTSIHVLPFAKERLESELTKVSGLGAREWLALLVSALTDNPAVVEKTMLPMLRYYFWRLRSLSARQVRNWRKTGGLKMDGTEKPDEADQKRERLMFGIDDPTRLADLYKKAIPGCPLQKRGLIVEYWCIHADEAIALLSAKQ
jgi:hypothetical protein